MAAVFPFRRTQRGGRRATRRRRWGAALLGGAIALVMLALLTRFLAVQGRLQPIRVGGQSMAPTLLGPHRLLQCPQCQIPWTAHPVDPAAPLPAACYNCGEADTTELADAPLHAGERVRIDRAAYWIAPPQRGDLVAIRDGRAGLRVKRIVGLPGERVELAQGQLWIDGEPLRPTLPEVLPRLIPVHDDAYRSAQGSRWIAADDSPWQPIAQGFRYEFARGTEANAAAGKAVAVETSAAEAAQWLVYHHRSIHAGGAPDTIRDDYPGNIDQSRQLYPAEDLVVRLSFSAAVEVEVAFWGRRGVEGVRWEASAGAVQRVARLAGRYWIGDAAGAESQIGSRPSHAPLSEQRPLAIRLRAIGPHPEPGEEAVALQMAPPWIGRDLVYMVRGVGLQRWSPEAPLAADRYFVLGDNLPVSVDSRHEPQGVRRQEIVGRVLPYRRSRGEGEEATVVRLNSADPALPTSRGRGSALPR